ncbi:OmpA family protein [Solimonas terrae]|uniref:OmpA family protein n=1 Tax=Solimonas terrae TaxID=1396819 RepID=A0A6M2BWB6_9GAMM|nr:OmpA family protein [Solimonas terrae]NGY06788.1 OmpA family protein [Solimonas terrae]
MKKIIGLWVVGFVASATLMPGTALAQYGGGGGGGGGGSAPSMGPAEDTPQSVEDERKALSPLLDGGYVSVMGTYQRSLKDDVLSNNLGGAVLIGYRDWARHYALETGFGDTVESGIQRQSAKIKLLVFPFDSVPMAYGVFGTGMTRFFKYPHGYSPDLLETSKHKDFYTVDVSGGLGYMFPLHGDSYDWALRAEVLFQLGDRFLERENDFQTDIDAPGTFKDIVLNIGLQLPTRKKQPKPEKPAEDTQMVAPAAPVDTDGDGVMDPGDQCPDTPAGTQVNAVGCPLPPPCKPPEAGQRVDLSGCAVGDTIVLRGVNFEFNKATLTVNAKTLLDGVSDALTAAPDIRVEVGGHTDSKGSDDYNQKLSEARAQSVMAYLIERGIAADRMTAVGYGETQPVADNDTDEGRELNRRVELKITNAASAATAAVPASSDAAPADQQPMPDDAQGPAAADDSTAVPAEDGSAPADEMTAPPAADAATPPDPAAAADTMPASPETEGTP